MKAKAFIVGFFAVVAVIAAVSIYFSVTTEKTTKSVTALTSPDGKFKTVEFTLTEGGAKPFCVVSISVMLAVYPDDFAQQRKEYEVLSASCDTFANGEPSPKIEWVSNANLQITRVPDAKAARAKNIDVTKSVHVIFVDRN